MTCPLQQVADEPAVAQFVDDPAAADVVHYPVQEAGRLAVERDPALRQAACASATSSADE